ncbi:MAG: 50S ribosomal protein L25/general stress protein Ctc, partial [Rhizobiaceae bacterium]
KGSARAVRRNGRVPAVIYGDKQAPISISLDYKEVYYKIHGGGFLHTVATIDVNGEKIRVLPKDYQLDPVKDFPTHVDFLRVSANSRIKVEIPVHFINQDISVGLKRGGILNIVRHEIECLCPVDAIPNYIEFDLAKVDVGHSVHISAVTLPEGVKPVIDRDFTVATIVSPGGALEEEAAPAA